MIFQWKVLAVAIALLFAACIAQTLRLSAAEASLAAKDAEIAQIKQAATQAALATQTAFREMERERTEEVERIAQDAQARVSAADDRARRAGLAAGGLRDEIRRLNARAAPADSGAAAFADEAAVARELLGACAEEYRGVAAEADGLRVQVTGLQDYAHALVSR